MRQVAAADTQETTPMSITLFGDYVPLLLLVDDVPENLELLSDCLDDYRLTVATNGVRALELANGSRKPDLILLDVNMPGMDGYDVLARLQEKPTTADIPVIFVTAMSDSTSEEKGLALGAVDYVSKPINASVLHARVSAHLALKAAKDSLSHRAAVLEEEVLIRTREAVAMQDVAVHAMASLAEARDNETGNHLLRTKNYVRLLAEELSARGHYTAQLNPAYIDRLYKSAPLHDIGKVAIPDSILQKAGKLTAEEFEIMKTHTTLGYEAICNAEQALGMDLNFFDCAKDIALYHQEKWDGSGYPQGLFGEAIPLSARLMAVADVYDALISERVYKKAFSHQKAVIIIEDGRGKHFDPVMVDVFLQIQTEVQGIAQRYSDA